MEYPIVLGILAAFFACVAGYAFGLKKFFPEPPPKGGMLEPRERMSFTEFHRTRSRTIHSSSQNPVLAEHRRTA